MTMDLTEKTSKLSFGRMIGYGMGGFGGEFLYTTISIFALYYFTDVALIGAAVAGMLLMVARLWDAFADILMGYISDHTKSRWGQRRPYILFGAIPVGVLLYLLFQTPSLPPIERIIYYGAIIILVWTAFTVVYVPYNAMVPAITRDPKEQSRLVGVQRILVVIAGATIGGLAKPLVASFPTEQIGWSNLGLIFAIVLVVCQFITFFSTKERYTSETEAYRFRDSYKLIFKNKPFMLVCIATACVFINFTVVGAMVNYFFKYNVPNEGFVPIALLSIYGFAALVMPLWVLLSNRIGKKSVYIISFAIFGFCNIFQFFVYTQDMAVLLSLFITYGIGFSGLMLSLFAIVPETVDYGEWKTGIRTQGIQYGTLTFVFKLAASVAGMLIGFGLELFGYVANAVQSQSTLMGMRVLTTLFPAAITAIGIIALFFYPINSAKHAMMVREIEERKK